jgi:hypothetical protein
VIFVSVLPLAWEIWKRVRKSTPPASPAAHEADAVKAPASDGPR